MIRAFITTWTRVDNEIKNPISLYLDANNPAFSVECSMHYPPALADGTPSGQFALVLVRSPSAQIENFNNLAGVKMLPAVPFSALISTVPQAKIDSVKTLLSSKGFPVGFVDNAQTYGDVLRKIAKYFHPQHVGFGSWEDAPVEYG